MKRLIIAMNSWPKLAFGWLGHLLQDFRFAVRLWRKQPGSFLSAIAALTLGLGLVTFSLGAINCVFFGKLPFPNADRIVYTTVPEWAFRDFSQQQTCFEGLSAFKTASVNFQALETPVRRRACFISTNFLDVIRATPAFGRGFLPGDDQPGAERVALVGYDLWQRELQADPAAVGSIIRLDGQPTTIVGIMPKGFKFPIDEDLWVPADPVASRTSGWGFAFGRLQPAGGLADARMELNLIAARVAATRSPEMRPSPVLVGPFTRYLSDLKGPHGPGPSMFAMLFLTLLVLFIACANVAGLTLANAVKRGTELAVRGALGATRARLISQLLVESLILAVGGALGGLLVIAVLSRWFEGWFSSTEAQFSQVPFWMRLRIDGRLLLSLIGLVFLANLLAGLWPALQATRRDVNDLLKVQTGGTAGVRVGKLQRLLVLVQIAFSVVVLTQACVLLNFSQRLQNVRLPFDPAAVLTARVDLPSAANARSFFGQLEDTLAGIPGLNSIALSSKDPISGHAWNQIEIEGLPDRLAEHELLVASEVVSDGYFQALNLPLLQGRRFNEGDGQDSRAVTIVNSTFIKRFLSPGDPIGRRFREGTNQWLTIIGWVPDFSYEPLTENPRPVYFVPMSQRPVQSMVLMVRGSGRALDWTKTLRTEVARLQPDVAIHRVATIQTLMDHQTIGYHLASRLLVICGVGSLFLATLGIFGLISLSVGQRTREIGVRLALGASRGRITTTLVQQAVRQILAGLAVGSVLAFSLSQLVSHTIAGYPTVDSPVLLFLAVVAFLGTISFLAVLVPAARGARIDPMEALRYE